MNIHDKSFLLAKEYLDDYSIYKGRLKILNIELASAQELLNISRNSTTANISRIEDKIQQKSEQIKLISLLIQKIDIALDALAEIDKNILIDRSIKKLTWNEIASKYNCSARNAQRKYNSGINDMSRTIFTENMTIIRLKKEG